MAFAIAGLQNVAVGPRKLWIYSTADTLTSANVKADFDTTNIPGIAVGDIILICNADDSTFSSVMITAVDATSCTIALHSTLA